MSRANFRCWCIFHAAHLKKCLDHNIMHIPSPHIFPGRSAVTPYVFVGDDAFPFCTNILKPFPGSYDKESKERIFNYRLNRARRVSENVFDIISSVFRVLRKPMLSQPDIATKTVLAIIYLHNFLRKSSSRRMYNPPGMFDIECADRGEISDCVWRKDKSHLSGMSAIQKLA
ncbi:hypothetical protein PGB90_008580 [Kerria lacca]